MANNTLTSIMAQAAAKKSGQTTNAQHASSKGGSVFSRLRALYADMESAYADCAAQAGLTCENCTTNCCTSFFQHHTYIEWAYLWRGLENLKPEQRDVFINRSHAYVDAARQTLAAGTLPDAMCPLNDDGLCALYPFRLMICRMHGTRNVFTLPDGRSQTFPGCARFTALPCAQPENENACPTLDRTLFYRELASIETDFLRKSSRPMPRVNLTLAEMIVIGPPSLR